MAEHGAEVSAAGQTREHWHRNDVAFAYPAVCKAVTQAIHSSCICSQSVQLRLAVQFMLRPRQARGRDPNSSPSVVLKLGESPPLEMDPSKTCGNGSGRGSG